MDDHLEGWRSRQRASQSAETAGVAPSHRRIHQGARMNYDYFLERELARYNLDCERDYQKQVYKQQLLDEQEQEDLDSDE